MTKNELQDLAEGRRPLEVKPPEPKPPAKPTTIKICWRGIIDEALETGWGWNPARTWEANIPQEILTKEESHALFAKGQHKDGRIIEKSIPQMLPDGRRLLITTQEWSSMHEEALIHPCFDVEGEQPKVMKKRIPPKPGQYPNASQERESWTGPMYPIEGIPEPQLKDI